MTYFDIIFLIPLIWGAIMGFRKGLILELASLLALILGIWGAIKFSSQLAIYLKEHIDASANLVSILSFILTFVIIVISIYLLAKIIDKTLKMAAMGLPIRLAGALFGLLKYALVLNVALYVFEYVNNKWEFVDKKEYESAYVYQFFNKINEPLMNWLDQLDINKQLETAKDTIALNSFNGRNSR